MRRENANRFKTLEEAGLAARVLTEVLCNIVPFLYLSDGDPIRVHSIGDEWEVESNLDFVDALFLWRHESTSDISNMSQTWVNDARSKWEEWKANASENEYRAVERKVTGMLETFREDVAYEKSLNQSFDNPGEGD